MTQITTESNFPELKSNRIVIGNDVNLTMRNTVYYMYLHVCILTFCVPIDINVSLLDN